MRTKTCTRCKTEKSKDFFGIDRAQKDGLAKWCRECKNAHARKWHNENPVAARAAQLKKNYGLTPDEWDTILNEQDGVCANPACNNLAVHTDHDHSCCPGFRSCGKCIRGILCAGCNLAAGQVKDDGAVLRGLADYLDMYKQTNEIFERNILT